MAAALGSDAAPSLAVHYERLAFDRQLRDGRELLQMLRLTKGMRVLQLDCGIGILAEELAEVVGDLGEVLGLDSMPLRVQIAHQRSRRNLRFQVGTVADLARLPSASFDAIVANGVLHGWGDAGRAAAHCLRLLAPDGCLALATYSAAHEHPAALVRDAVLAGPAYAAHALPSEAVARPLTATEVDALLRKAGFGAICIHASPEVHFYAGAQSAIEAMQAAAWGHFLAHLPGALRETAYAEVVHRLEAMRGRPGIRHDAMRLSVVARRAHVDIGR